MTLAFKSIALSHVGIETQRNLAKVGVEGSESLRPLQKGFCPARTHRLHIVPKT